MINISKLLSNTIEGDIMFIDKEEELKGN